MLIIVNHRDKTIIPCDLKTSSNKEWDFPKSFIKWGYWIQAQLYWYIINQNIQKDEFFKDYKLLNYRFIVINKFNNKPLIWEYSDTKAIVDTTYGLNNQISCRNWRHILEELHYYISNNNEYPLDINPTGINDIKRFLNYDCN